MYRRELQLNAQVREKKHTKNHVMTHHKLHEHIVECCFVVSNTKLMNEQKTDNQKRRIYMTKYINSSERTLVWCREFDLANSRFTENH